jgi:hypothetical protein
MGSVADGPWSVGAAVVPVDVVTDDPPPGVPAARPAVLAHPAAATTSPMTTGATEAPVLLNTRM